jgi:hypothetical protein
LPPNRDCFAFLRVGDDGSEAAVDSHQAFQRTTLPFLPINYPGGAQARFLMVKYSPIPFDLAPWEKRITYVVWGEIPVGPIHQV